MAALPLQLPTIQNWSCHSCSQCCRQHAIEVTDEERRRIEGQHWSEADGIPADQPLFAWHAGPPWKKRYRLAHQPDGACVFLDEHGLCRIHAKFGEAAKPLPCRIYPYAFHPGGKRVTVSLRFSCPSVVGNRGRPVTKQKGELKKLARTVIPEGVERIPPPDISPGERVDWSDFHRFLSALDTTLSGADVSFPVKLMRALFWVNLVGQSKFDEVQGARLDEFLEIIREAAQGEVPDDPRAVDGPSRVGRLQFRMLVAQYARKDTFVDAESGLVGRWRLLKAALRFARGTGTVPPLQNVFREVPFESVEQPFGGLPDEADDIFTRYFRVKIEGIHFCGRPFYGLPFVEGFQSLALIYPAIMWLSRWLAAGEGRTRLDADDVARAVSIADHYHAYSPAFGRRNFRRRVRMLAQTGDISKLCAWYTR